MPDVRLIPFTADHLRDHARMLEDPDIIRFTRVPEVRPPNYVRSWFAGYELGRTTGTREIFAIVDGDDAYLGVAVVPRIAPEGRTAELGYVVAPWARGRGVATEALRLLTGWALETLDPMRLELLISPDNQASKRVATKCGYVYEGTLRMAHFKDDLWEDCEIWSRIATDPDPFTESVT